MTADELDRLDREQREADARYNRALTELDHVIVSAQGRDLSREDFARVGTALLGFLQQITAFVDSKARRLAAAADARANTLLAALQPIDEMRTQIRVLQRAIESVATSPPAVRAVTGPQAVPGAAPQTAAAADYTYVAFEDQFRGPDAAVEERLRAYLPLFDGCTNVLDVGCGRGEFLSALKAAGVRARGVDANGSMVAVARDRGLDVVCADALGYVSEVATGSLGGLIATQVVEHLDSAYLIRLIEQAARALRPDAPIVLETINPACWLAFFSSYIRDLTHVHPVHPDTLQYLLRAHGFSRVEIRYSAPVPDTVKMKTIDLPADVLASSDATSAALARVAHAINANAVILNNLMFTYLDYAAVGYRS